MTKLKEIFNRLLCEPNSPLHLIEIMLAQVINQWEVGCEWKTLVSMAHKHETCKCSARLDNLPTGYVEPDDKLNQLCETIVYRSNVMHVKTYVGKKRRLKRDGRNMPRCVYETINRARNTDLTGTHDGRVVDRFTRARHISIDWWKIWMECVSLRNANLIFAIENEWIFFCFISVFKSFSNAALFLVHEYRFHNRNLQLMSY